MKHEKLPKSPSAQFKATIMDFLISYEKSTSFKSQLHVIQKTYKKLNLAPFTFLEIFWPAQTQFWLLFCVFPGCHGNQVPFLFFFIFLQLKMI